MANENNGDLRAKTPVPVGDLYGPTFTVKFYVGNSTVPNAKQESFKPITGTPEEVASAFRYNLGLTKKLAESPELQIQLDKAHLEKYAAHLSIEANLGAPHIATLTLNPPFEDAIKILDSRLIRFYSIMEIRWGYHNNLREPQYFRLTQPKATFTPKDITIVLQGIDLTSSILTNSGTFLIFDRDTYKTDLSIIQNIIETRRKMVLDITNLPEDSLLRKEKVTPANNMGNDYLFLKKLCFDNGVTFDIDLKGNRFKIRQADLFATTEPSYFLKVYQRTTGAYDIPVINFSANLLSSAFYSPAITTVLALQPNLDKQDASIANTIDAGTLAGIHAGDRTEDANAAGAGAFTGKGTKIGEDTVIPDQYYDSQAGIAGERITIPPGVSIEKVNNIVREAALRANTTATVTALGVPTVEPTMCVRVDGMGKSLSGHYFIRKVHHEIGRGGYEMTLDLYRTLTDAALTPPKPQSGPIISKSGDASSVKTKDAK